MKQKLLYLVCVLMGLHMPLAAQFSGTGTAADPYRIETAEQLAELRNYVGAAGADKYFRQENDIDLAQWIGTNNEPDIKENGWIPIGENAFNAQTSFCGSFNGQGFRITGLWIDRPGMDYVGLFGALHANGTLQNVKVVLDAKGIKGNDYVGGLAGGSQGEVTSCSVEGSGTVAAGGGDAWVGGLTGDNWGSITSSYATVSVTAEGDGAKVGGLTGYNEGSITTSYATGSVTAGGDGAKVGGLTGDNWGSITTSYATGSVEAGGDKAWVGGLTGSNENFITTSYATGSVTATKPSSFAGGLIGVIYENAVNNIASCYYLQEGNINQDLRGVGGYFNNTIGSDHPYDDNTYPSELTTNATGLTASEMASETSFAGWDFTDTWGMIDRQPSPILWAPLFAGGDGTPGTPYQVATADQMNYVRYRLDKHFLQINNIDLAQWIEDHNEPDIQNKGWMPVGEDASNAQTSFTGSFDGKGLRITGLWIDRQGMNDVGLFGALHADGTLQNIKVVLDANGVKGNNFVGGLVGYNWGKVTSCSVEGSGTVTAGVDYALVGGLTGNNWGTITTSYATGSVTAGGDYAFVGGLTGNNYGSITTSYATGSVAAEGYDAYVGGLTGSNEGSTTTSYATGSVTAEGDGAFVGGLTGLNADWGSITTSYATGSVEAGGDAANVGGLTGYNWGSITSSYVTSSVTATGQNAIAGGLIGVIHENAVNDITSCYYLQEEKTNRGLRGVGGYYDINDGTDYPYANGSYPLEDNTIPLTVSAMMTRSEYSSWKFLTSAAEYDDQYPDKVWLIDEGATSPYLWWQYGAAYRPVPVAEPLDNAIYHTVTLVVDSGIQLYNFSPGPLVVADGDHLYLQFLPESPGLTAADLVLTINGTDTPFKDFGSNRYCSYTLNPVDKDYEIRIALRDNTVGNAAIHAGKASVAVESGQLKVESPHPVDVAVYTITGQSVVFVRALSGTKTFDLPSGIYIVRAGTTTTKVVIND